MIKILITALLAFAIGYCYNEYSSTDPFAPVLHTIENTAKAVQADHVALERDLARRERRDEEMFALFDRVLTIIEADVAQKKVAVDRSSTDNKEQ